MNSGWSLQSKNVWPALWSHQLVHYYLACGLGPSAMTWQLQILEALAGGASSSNRPSWDSRGLGKAYLSTFHFIFVIDLHWQAIRGDLCGLPGFKSRTSRSAGPRCRVIMSMVNLCLPLLHGAGIKPLPPQNKSASPVHHALLRFNTPGW